MDLVLQDPFPAWAIPSVWRWMEPFRARIFGDDAPRSIDAFVDAWEQDDATGRQTWAVSRGGELGGAILAQDRELRVVFKPSFWRGQLPARAIGMALERLFAQDEQRITLTAFRDNRALLSIAKQAGGRREGVRSAQRGGKHVDQIVIGFTKGQHGNAHIS